MHIPPRATRLPLASSVLCFLALLLAAAAVPRCAAATYYVSPAGNDANAGTPAAPLLTIQRGINKASGTDTVVVTNGTYTGPGNVDLDFGGKNLTVQSQNGPAATLIDCGGPNAGNHRGFYFHSGETTAVLQGLTIQNGYENSTAALPQGSGVLIAGGSSVTLTDCAITDSYGSNGGGGVYLAPGGTATLTGCTLTRNSGGSGAGVYNAGTVTLTDCKVSLNHVVNLTDSEGGGLYNKLGGMLVMLGGSLIGNRAINGSGIANHGDAALIGSDVVANTGFVFTANTMPQGGGAFNHDGTLTMIGCRIWANKAYYGGGVLNVSDLSLIDCTIEGNTADSVGGVNNFNGTATVTNCTVVGNTGGVFNNETATITMLNDIVYGNTGEEVTGTVGLTVTYCDILNGFPGTGNFDADPLFVDPANGDYHLTPQSPCLGAGNSNGAPDTDKDGNPRPNPPSVGAYESASAALKSSYLLWANTNGQAAVWNLGDANPAATAALYGPFSGWTAKVIAQGPDGHGRILWTNTDGRAALWNLADANPAATAAVYGPYPGWTAKALTVGPDNAAHLLWDNTDGRVALWNTTDAVPASTAVVAGPFAGWSGVAIGIGGNGQERLLWDNTSGQVAVWNLSEASPSATALLYGPFSGWTAKRLSVGPDNAVHLLWDNVSGQVAVWNLSDANPAATALLYGPYGGWSGQDLSVGSDNKGRLLWDNVSGQVSLWNLSDANPSASYSLYGPFSGWTAVSTAAGQ